MSAQLSLWMLAEAEQSKSGKRGRYDSETFKRLYPIEHAMVVELLCKGVFSKSEISRQVECAYETVMAVSLAHEAEIRGGKRGMIRTLEITLAYSGDKLIERAKRGEISPLEHAILIDKLQLLSGGVTERVGHVVEQLDPEVEEFRKLSGETIDVPGLVLGMGSEGGNLLQEGGLGELPEIDGDEGSIIEAIEQNPEERDNESAQDNTQQVEPE